jgi:hypothetical protein
MTVHDNRSFARSVTHGNLFMRACAAPPEWLAAEVLACAQSAQRAALPRWRCST